MQNGEKSFLDRYFYLSERKKQHQSELGGGLATFMTMSYILIVHPLIMKNAGMPMKEVFTVTALMWAILHYLWGFMLNFLLLGTELWEVMLF